MSDNNETAGELKGCLISCANLPTDWRNFMTERTIEWATTILGEVVAENGRARAWLWHKCNWEHMSALAVIREWGDPRKVCTCGYDDDGNMVDNDGNCPLHEVKNES